MKGRMISGRFPNHCIGPSGKVGGEYTSLGLLQCYSSKGTRSWFLTSQGEIRYGASNFFINIEEDSDGRRLRIGPPREGKPNTIWAKIPARQFQE